MNESDYERKRIRRQRQLDLMEASASGLLISYNDGVYGEFPNEEDEEDSSVNSHSTTSQAPKGAIESARRFLWDEDEDEEEDYNQSRNRNQNQNHTVGSGSGTGTGSAPLHKVSIHDNYSYSGQSQQQNLTGETEKSPPLSSRMANTIMGSLFRGQNEDPPPKIRPKERNLAPYRSASQYTLNDARPREAEEYNNTYTEEPRAGLFSVICECCMAVIYTVVGLFTFLCEYLTACFADITPKLCVMIVAVLTGFAFFAFAIFAIVHRSKNGGGTTNYSENAGSQQFPPIEDEVRYADLRSAITTMTFTNENTLDTPGTAQNQALRWLTDKDPANLPVDDNSILQRYALATFYFSTYANAEIIDAQGNAADADADAWTYSDNWMSKRGVCMWFGVSCTPQVVEGFEEVHYDDYGYIFHLNLTDNNMRGIIPSELATLENLVSLDLSFNQLKGTVPTALANLKQLRQLDLENNSLDGRVHAEYGKMFSLRDLLLGTNKFTGSIPEEIGQLKELRALGLDDNILTGTIPNIWSSTKLMLLYLDSNQLTGTLSPKIKGMRELIDLRLRMNTFTGTIPDAIHSLALLELLYLDNNKFTGTLPDLWDLLSRLQELQLYENALTGTLPDSMRGLNDLKILYMDKNKFKGTLPASYGEMSEMETFFASDNELTGTVPTTLGNLADLKDFRIYNNQLGGALPSELGNCYKLEKLEVQDNTLTGNVPSELGAIQNLKILKLYHTALTGSMPKEICDANDLNQLEIMAADCNIEEGGTLECSCCSSCYP